MDASRVVRVHRRRSTRGRRALAGTHHASRRPRHRLHRLRPARGTVTGSGPGRRGISGATSVMESTVSARRHLCPATSVADGRKHSAALTPRPSRPGPRRPPPRRPVRARTATMTARRPLHRRPQRRAESACTVDIRGAGRRGCSTRTDAHRANAQSQPSTGRVPARWPRRRANP